MTDTALIPLEKPPQRMSPAEPASPEVYGLWLAKHRFNFGAGVAYAAANEGRVDIIRHMMANADLAARVYRAFFKAAAANDERALRAMITAGIDVNHKTKRGKTAIGETAYHSANKAAFLLLENGAYPDQRMARGWTPLMWAAYCNNDQLATALLEAGAKHTAVNDDGDSVLTVAASSEADETLRVIRGFAHRKLLEENAKKLPALSAPVPAALPKGWKVIADNGVEMAIQNISSAPAGVFITNIFDFKGKRLMTQFNSPPNSLAVSDKRFDDVDPEFVKEARAIFEAATVKPETSGPGGLM